MKTNRSIQLLAIVALGVLGAVTAGVVAHAGTTRDEDDDQRHRA